MSFAAKILDAEICVCCRPCQGSVADDAGMGDEVYRDIVVLVGTRIEELDLATAS